MPRTLEQGFENFLDRLAPLQTEHDKAKRHKDRAESCLINNFKCYSFFETGSFGNGTGVRHYSDTDYFAACPSEQFWGSSGYTLRKIREALDNTFWQTSGIEVKTPAIQIPLGTYASETLEITPCTFNGLVDTPVGKKASYDIANFEDGWMKSSPQAHNAYVQRENNRLNKKVKPLIQLVKAWKFYNNVPISSFYLELRVTKYAENENYIIYDIDLKSFIKHLNDIKLANIIDPMGISGYVNACSSDAKKQEALSKLSTALSRAEKAYDERDKDLDKCFYWWDMFYNGKFPSR
jgi:hypothetical protein